MVKSLNNEVLEKVDEIVSYIENSDSYKKYQDISLKMKNDNDIMTRINSIKKIQKKIVKLESLKEDISPLEAEIESILEELNSYPIYQEYTYLLEDLNNTFQNIKTIIENYINDKLN